MHWILGTYKTNGIPAWRFSYYLFWSSFSYRNFVPFEAVKSPFSASRHRCFLPPFNRFPSTSMFKSNLESEFWTARIICQSHWRRSLAIFLHPVQPRIDPGCPHFCTTPLVQRNVLASITARRRLKIGSTDEGNEISIFVRPIAKKASLYFFKYTIVSRYPNAFWGVDFI